MWFNEIVRVLFKKIGFNLWYYCFNNWVIRVMDGSIIIDLFVVKRNFINDKMENDLFCLNKNYDS